MVDQGGGVFSQLQALLLDQLGEAGRIDLERVSAVRTLSA